MSEQLPGLVAVDAGGTSTRAVVLDPTGRCLGRAVAGSGNPTAVGPETAARSVAESVAEALVKARIGSSGIASVVLAMAGAGSPSVAAEVRTRLAGSGLDRPVAFESDLVATFVSGTLQPDGYAVISGTGAAAIRVEQGRQVAVADGLGWLLGDEGSGFWIGHRVVRAALADLDGRGPATALTPVLLGRLGLAVPAEAADRAPILAVVQALYAGPPVRLADYARLAFEVHGDAITERILDDAAAALEQTLAAVRSPTVSGPVVLGGGVLGHGGPLVDRLVAARGGAEVQVVADGVIGVCVLALRRAGTAVDELTLERLTTSLAALR